MAIAPPSSPAGWAEKLTDAVIRQKIGEPLTAADLDFSNADFRNIKFREVLPPCFLGPNGDIIKGFNFSNSKSTAFARYSSSAIFGTEHDSPTILRGYA
ncbi:hypothetical protein CTZ44_25445, partial [Salmonella enterica]|nr:hypothetical protein [Salmonella enterica]EDV3123501.1 hypothetical protein [Salmonella enterica subsp. enterica]EGX0284835.1 hypothetical protein [Salmonella enterica]